MCTQAQLTMVLKEIYNKSVELFGDKLDAVILYGSYARGDYDEESDIDVMVRVRMDREMLSAYRSRVSSFANKLDWEYGTFISIKLQDYETFEQYKDDMPYFKNIIKDGVRVAS